MKKILLLQTGGTISMGGTGHLHQLDREAWGKVLKNQIPELNKMADIEVEHLFAEDSSDIHHRHWQLIAETVEKHYDAYDGFVILHGTDTMAYTASALSFCLRNLDKPVILTGSQVPLSNLRSDARRNLINSIEIATMSLNEVAICFNDHVYRGNRSTKMSIGDFDAFASPNYPPLAEIGLHIELRDTQLPANDQDLHITNRFDDRLLLLKSFPGLNSSHVNPDWSQLRAIVLEAFGSGNFPLKDPEGIWPLLKKGFKNNILIIITSQAPYDSVDLTKYESGHRALDRGALGAGDMTVEATITKLMHLLGQSDDNDYIRKNFQEPIAGEITH